MCRWPCLDSELALDRWCLGQVRVVSPASSTPASLVEECPSLSHQGQHKGEVLLGFLGFLFLAPCKWVFVFCFFSAVLLVVVIELKNSH